VLQLDTRGGSNALLAPDAQSGLLFVMLFAPCAMRFTLIPDSGRSAIKRRTLPGLSLRHGLCLSPNKNPENKKSPL